MPAEYHWTVRNLRTWLGMVEQTHLSAWGFSYNGAPIGEDHTLSHYGVGHGSKVYLNTVVTQRLVRPAGYHGMTDQRRLTQGKELGNSHETENQASG